MDGDRPARGVTDLEDVSTALVDVEAALVQERNHFPHGLGYVTPYEITLTVPLGDVGVNYVSDPGVNERLIAPSCEFRRSVHGAPR